MDSAREQRADDSAKRAGNSRSTLVRAWRRLAQRRGGVVYLAEFSLADGAGLLGPVPATVRGLVLLSVAQEGDRATLITWWASRDEFKRDGVAFREALRLGAPRFTGYLRDVHEPGLRLWNRVRPHTAVLGLVALLGAMEALRAHYDWLFLPAQPLASADRSTAVNYVVDQQIDEAITIANRTPVDHRDIQLDAEVIGSGLADLHAAPAVIPSLSPGSSMNVRLLATAKTRGAPVVTLAIIARAGRIWPATTNRFQIPIHVWSAHPVAQVLNPRLYTKAVEIDGVLETGYAAEAGVKCIAEFNGDLPIADVNVDMPGIITVSRWESTGTGPARTGSITWETQKIDAFRRTFFKLFLTPLESIANWPKAAGQPTVTCEERSPK